MLISIKFVFFYIVRFDEGAIEGTLQSLKVECRFFFIKKKWFRFSNINK